MIKLVRPVCPNPSSLRGRNYKHPDNKEALRKASYDKCMYCESKIPHVDFAHVEHIKPKVTDKFPELEFTWENLGYACARCNNAKSNKYFEDTPFIDPYAEEPSDFVIFSGAFMFHRNGGERGEISIREIELNRPELIERRMEKIKVIQKTLEACFRTQNEALKANALAALQLEASNDKEYSLVASFFLKAHGALWGQPINSH